MNKISLEELEPKIEAVGWVDGCYPALFFSINTDQKRDLTPNTSTLIRIG
jgi:hypothetical protein